MLPNLVGQIVILQTNSTPPRLPEPFICVYQDATSITVAGTNGGFGSRVLTFRLFDVVVLGFFESLEVVEQQLKMIDFTLTNEVLSLTEAGRLTLLAAQSALAKVLENGLRSKIESSRAAEDYRIKRYRTEEDKAQCEFFAKYTDVPSEIESLPPARGETFSEQAFSEDVEPATAGVDVGKVKVHIVIEHRDPAIVKQVAARVREILSKVDE